MAAPKELLENLMERKSGLEDQLRLMRNHLADPQRNPSFGTHTKSKRTTEESIASAKEHIAKLEELIAKVGMSGA